MAQVQFQSGVLFVSDIGRSKAFYTELLGQQILMDHGLNVGFQGGFGLWQADHAEQMVYGRPLENRSVLGSDNLELYFETDDLEGLATRLEAVGVAMVHPIVEQPWAQRCLRFYDPDRHIVEVGEPMSGVVKRLHAGGLSVEGIAARTYMPASVVEVMLKS